jgi:hypothetical protein
MKIQGSKTQQISVIKQNSVNSTNVAALPCGAAVFPSEAGCSAPNRTRSVPSAGKDMASVFWDAEGILFIEYFEKGKTIAVEYYSNLLIRLGDKIREKRPGLQKKK